MKSAPGITLTIYVFSSSYFHPDTDRHKAECMLLQNGEVGNYLIRNGSDKNSQCYVVSVRYGILG